MKLFHRHHQQYPIDQHHQAFWSTTQFGQQAAKSYDTLDQDPQHLNNFENFLGSFGKDTSFPAYLQNGLPSLVNSNAQVTKDQCVASLIDKKNHALLAIESLTPEGLRIDWFDFIVRNTHHHHVISKKLNTFSFGASAVPEIFLNKRETAMVRYCPTNNGNGLTNIPLDMTKEELFAKLNWNPDAESWTMPVENAKRMFASIREDYDKANEELLKFKFCGHPAPYHFAEPGHEIMNCKTWAINKLRSADVQVEIDKHNFMNKIIAHNIAVRR